jgi:N-acetylglucosaminyldiphosphoundecaprenol N-acetyl-beta-D-mannosaminyltransferase
MPSPTIQTTHPFSALPSFVAEAQTVAQVPRIHLGHLAVDTYTKRDFLREVLDHALYGQRTRHIVTANAQFYVLAEKNLRFRRCIASAEYICADGMSLVWACNRLMHTSIPRINGTDLIEEICRDGAPQGLRVFLLGGKPGAADATTSVLEARYPGIVIAGTNCPEPGFERSAETLDPVLEHIARAQPHVIFVSLGAPKQEFFIHQYLRPLRIPLAVGIGGSFELICGQIDRAPKWMQRSGLEWAFRFAQEPQRLWRRYLIGNVEFLWCLARWRSKLALRERRSRVLNSRTREI